MLAMAHTLLNEDRHDAQFVARYCAGFERFRRYLLGLDDGVAKDAACGGSDHRRRRRDDPRARAARGGDTQHDHLRVVAAARAPR